MMEGEAHAAGMMGPGRGPGHGQARLPVRDVHVSTPAGHGHGHGHGHLLEMDMDICWAGASAGCPSPWWSEKVPEEVVTSYARGYVQVRLRFEKCRLRTLTCVTAESKRSSLRALEAFDPRGQRLHPTRTT